MRRSPSTIPFLRQTLARVSGVLVLVFSLSVQAVAAPKTNPSVKDITASAMRYLHGEGVVADPDRGLVYLCVAAYKGDGNAAYELGWLYLQGRGVARNDGLAAAWLREAQRLGEQLPARLIGSVDMEAVTSHECITTKGLRLQLRGGRHADLVLAIYDLAPQYNLDPALVVEVVRAESNFNPRAISHKGALGLMQLIPATARRFGVNDPMDPMQNLHGGMAYLRWLLDRFNGNLRLMLAGYNAGEAAVERHGGIPPYPETRAYVRRILARYSTLESPLPETLI